MLMRAVRTHSDVPDDTTVGLGCEYINCNKDEGPAKAQRTTQKQTSIAVCLSSHLSCGLIAGRSTCFIGSYYFLLLHVSCVNSL